MTELPKPEISLIPHAHDHALAPELRVTILSRYLLHLSERFAHDVRGTIIIIFALALPTMLLAVGAALDFGQLYAKRTALQGAADASALTAAQGFRLANGDKNDVEAVAKSSAMANLAEMPGTVGFSVAVNENPTSVTVELSQTPGLYFMDTLMGNKETVIKASATAQVIGSTQICVLALDDSAQGAISAEASSRLTGNDCAIYSNSTSSQSITAKNFSDVKASLICSSGGVNGIDHFEPGPLTDCPPMEDPLASRSPPSIGGCKTNWLYLKEDATLSPGVYCGGIEVAGGVRVHFNPGVYIIKDGPLYADDNSVLEGKNVGFYLTGNKAVLNFWPMSSISLTAPKDGPLSGLLFFEDRTRTTSGTHNFKSNDARLLLGTIYLPASSLVINAKSPIADESAYTVIIVNKLKLYDGPHLILNTDYSATDIPVPKGIRGTGNAVALTK